MGIAGLSAELYGFAVCVPGSASIFAVASASAVCNMSLSLYRANGNIGIGDILAIGVKSFFVSILAQQAGQLMGGVIAKSGIYNKIYEKFFGATLPLGKQPSFIWPCIKVGMVKFFGNLSFTSNNNSFFDMIIGIFN